MNSSTGHSDRRGPPAEITLGTRRHPGGERASEPTSAIRLHHFLASAGVASRRNCETYVRDGRVTVDGQEVRDVASTVDPAAQRVCLDGERVRPQPKRYYLLNKPVGYICTSHDPQGRPRALDLVPDHNVRLFTVGRLDENSAGLLIVTNDGDLANRLAHPRHEVTRVYRVQVAGIPDRRTLEALRHGLRFSDGRFRMRKVRRIKSQGRSAFLELELTEGRNREIRRMLARVGHKVLNLERIAFGTIRLGRLRRGNSRPLTRGEIQSLRDLIDCTAGTRRRIRTRGRRRRKTSRTGTG